MTRVLVVDDEPLILRILCLNLRARHYEVRAVLDGGQALRQAVAWQPDLVILDLGLPDLDGVKVIEELRAWSQMPIIVLSGRGGSQDEVDAFNAGADDYVVKPFGMDELIARVRAVIRRAPDSDPPPVVQVGAYRVDLARKTIVGPRYEPVHLTPIEWGILEPLLRSPRTLIGRRQLLTEVWGPGHDADTNYLRTYMASLRRKLEPIPARPRHLITEPGMGYRFEP